MEGSVTYGWSDAPGEYDVHAIFRVGNSAGQGGMVIIEDRPPVPPVSERTKPGTYTVTWEREIEADNPVEAAEKALAMLRAEQVEVDPPSVTQFLVDDREIDPNDPPYCSAQIFGGSRIDPPEWCDRVGTHWDIHGEPWCDLHSAQEDPDDGRDI